MELLRGPVLFSDLTIRDTFLHLSFTSHGWIDSPSAQTSLTSSPPQIHSSPPALGPFISPFEASNLALTHWSNDSAKIHSNKIFPSLSRSTKSLGYNQPHNHLLLSVHSRNSAPTSCFLDLRMIKEGTTWTYTIGFHMRKNWALIRHRI